MVLPARVLGALELLALLEASSAARANVPASVLYDLREGSFLLDDCRDCDRAPIQRPLSGTFLLGEIAGAPNPVSTYRVDGVDFHSVDAALDYRVSGSGIYRQGGEVALLQSMRLDTQVNGEPDIRLEAGAGPVNAVFPAIDIRLEHKDPATFLHVYTLRIVARPGEPRPVEFRRGDSNSDGGVDIADPVRVLLWLFAGGAAPGCLDAADANGDGRHDASDAVFLLGHLFLGGDPPPAPGPFACGLPATIVTGCAAYPACAAGA